MATFTQYVEAKNKNLKDLSNEEIYYLLLEFVKEAAAPKPKNDSKRKVYYISAEFLIGKLLSNNLINLGIYKDVKAELDAGLTTTVVFSNKSSKITNKMQNQTTGLKINHGWYQLISLTMFHSKTLL